MNTSTTARRLMLLALPSALASVAACVSQGPHNCKEVHVASAGVFCLDTTRFVGIAPGAGGLDGVAHYVEISPPSTFSANVDDVSRIILMPELPSEPPCAAAGIGFRCIARVPDKPLQVMVVFNQPGAGQFAERTQALAKEAGENVIKQWHKE